MSEQQVVAITRKVPGTVDLPGVEVRQGPEELPRRDSTLELIEGAHVCITMYTDSVDREFLERAGPQLRGVCNFAVGFDNIDRDACRQRGVTVTNTPHAVTEGTADLAWLLVMAAARRLIEADRYARSDDYPRRGQLGMSEFMGVDLTGRTLLIVGAGRIGYAVALRSLGWGMRVLYADVRQNHELEMAPIAAQRVELDEGLARADVVSVHTPLTPRTRHLINRERLGLMKKTAILVNTARGPVVEEAALVEALREGRIWGAGLDVFEHEPQIDPDLRRSERAVLTPHIGSAEIRYREQMTQMACANARAILAGDEPPNRVA